MLAGSSAPTQSARGAAHCPACRPCFPGLALVLTDPSSKVAPDPETSPVLYGLCTQVDVHSDALPWAGGGERRGGDGVRVKFQGLLILQS